MRLARTKYILLVVTTVVLLFVRKYKYESSENRSILFDSNLEECKSINNVVTETDKDDISTNGVIVGNGNDISVDKGRKSVPCYKNIFKNHVIVMNFNYPNYENNEILRDLYKGVFSVILTCGPQQQDPFQKGPDLWYDDGNWFYYRYLCLTLAMEKYPDYEGYFYSNDDLIINWWNLVQFNTSRIWQGTTADFHQNAFKEIEEVQWIWWKTPNGIGACQKYYLILKKLAQSHRLFKYMYTTYMENGQGDPRCSKGWSDMFYVPGRLREQYILLSKIAHRSKLILEIAVGNILRSLDTEQDIETLHGLYLPDLQLGVNWNKAEVFWRIYNLNLTFVHPVKFNNKDSDLTLSMFRNFVLPYKDLLTIC